MRAASRPPPASRGPVSHPAWRAPAGRPEPRRRGSVVVIVMVTLMFATFALVAFMEKASVDLLVEQREAVTRRLRTEAYSALETTLAVLNEFREAGQGLRSPAEGWGDPLGFAGYEPGDGRSVEVTFDDESGKISLPRATAPVLVALFKNWGVMQPEAERLADALLGWMKRDHVYSTSVQPGYEQGAIAFEPPGRPLRSYHELAAIEVAREFFYDPEGRPTEYWRRFADSVSLLDFRPPNLNAGKPDTLAALAGLDAQQQGNLADYFAGRGSFANNGQKYLGSTAEAQRVAGQTGDFGALGVTISALRITITVRDGRTECRLATVVAPPGSSATTVQQTATSTRTQTSAARSGTPQNPAPPPARAGQTGGNTAANPDAARNL